MPDVDTALSLRMHWPMVLEKGQRFTLHDCNTTLGTDVITDLLPNMKPDKGHLELVKQLLTAGASGSVQDRSGRGAIHHAADGGSEAAVRRLAAAGAPLEQADSEGWTPLMRAVMRGSPVSTLVELGARTDGCYRRGRQLRRMSPFPLRRFHDRFSSRKFSSVSFEAKQINKT